MILLVDKQEETGYVVTDYKTAGGILGVHPITVKRRLPFWESKRWILCLGEVKKSGRGHNNLPQKLNY
jgi:hypothetical protein